jgi:hypothetical protein
MFHTSHAPAASENIAPSAGRADWEEDDAAGWPVLRGTARQRDARFVRKLLKAQLAALRRRP